MGWSIGFDSKTDRDIGYGVPAYCDFPGCQAEIDRGLSYVCGGEPYGGDRGCGLFFCEKHTRLSARLPQLCPRCIRRRSRYPAKPDHPTWIKHKLKHPSWAVWRKENPEKVAKMRATAGAEGQGDRA